MRNYELTYLISPDLSEQELKTLSGKVNSFIQEEAGTLEKTTEPSKRKLSYFIKKKGEAFSITLNFSLSPEKLKNLEKKLKAETQILRYIILTKKISEKEPKPRRIGFKKDVLKTPEQIPQASEPRKVELKEIDKKIEEILKE